MATISEISSPLAPASASVWGSICELVRERGLLVGDQLPSIRELADVLEVKQTVVRDALLKAESKGLVKVLPRAGVFLRAISHSGEPSEPRNSIAEESLAAAFLPTLQSGEQNVLHLLDARRLIEVEMAGRTAERRRLEDLLPMRRALDCMLQLPAESHRAEHVRHDVRFHVEIARLSGNFVLYTVQRTLMDLLVPHLNQVPPTAQRHKITDLSHVAIYDAIVAGDAARARQEMREHLNLAYDSLIHDLQRSPAVAK